jgi:hypothetical protein
MRNESSNKAARLLTAGMVAICCISSAGARSTVDKSRETPGKAAFQAQQGAFKRDRKITKQILRHESANHRNGRHPSIATSERQPPR